MKASIGDRILVHGVHVDDAEREGEVLETRGEGGAPPYLVRWSDGSQGLVFPGPGTEIHSTNT